MSNWWPKKKGADGGSWKGPKPLLALKRGKKPPNLQPGEMVLEGEVQGLQNPMAWENTPSVLKEKFPHWKEASSSLKTVPIGIKDDSCPDEHPFQVSTSFKQPNNTIPYIVMECDTLNSIALKFDTIPGELAHINKKPSGSSFLFSGMVLYVPDPNCYSSTPPEILEAPKSAPPCLDRSFEKGLTESQETLRSSSTSHPSISGRKERSPCSHLELSSEWRTGFTEEMSESHLSVTAKYISDDQGCVHGKLLTSTKALMFQPHAKDPLVKEQRTGEYEILIPIEDVTYAAVSKECCLPHPEGLKLSKASAPSHSDSTEDATDQQSQASTSRVGSSTGDAKETSAPSSGDGLDQRGSTGEKMEVEAENEDARSGLEERAQNGDMKETPAVKIEFQIESSEDEMSKSGSESKLIQKSESGSHRTDDSGTNSLGHQASVESNDELFDIMGVPRNASNLSEVTKPHSDSVQSNNSTESLFTEPYFIHLRVYSKSGINYMYTPLSKKGIEIPRERDKSPVRQLKNFFCFAIPERRIDDLVDFLLSHHPKSEGRHLTRPSELEDGSILEFIGAGRRGSEELHFNDDHYSVDPDSWEIYSMKDIPKFRARIDKMEVEKDLPLPNLSDESHLMEEAHQRELVANLVYQAVGHDWYLVYSTFRDGISLRTLYRNMQNYDDTPILLLVQDDSNTLFGVMTSCRLRISDHFYGTGESFLFKFEDSDLKVYPWTALNNYFIKGNSDSIGFGSGDGHFGLWIHETLLQGSSYQCSTYDNECLASQQDFVCSGIEAWGFSKPSEFD